MEYETEKYWEYYKEARASGLTPNQAIIKAHELLAFGE
jgi:hypothetical protein